MSHSPAPLPPFEAIVTAHGAAVLRVCRAMVGANDAEDVWQETFIAALRAYPGSAAVINRRAWLVAISRNKAIDHHRRAGRLPAPMDPFLTEGNPGEPRRDWTDGRDGADAVEHVVEAAADAVLVWSALAQLPPRQREAVVYHHLAGLRYAEVAGLLGNSEAASRRAAADGMKALRALLGTDEGNRP